MRGGEANDVPALTAATFATIVSLDSVLRFWLGPLLPAWSVHVALVGWALAGVIALLWALLRRDPTDVALGAGLVCLFVGSMTGIAPTLADAGRLLAPTALAISAVLAVRRTDHWRRAIWWLVGVLALGWLSGIVLPIGLVLGMALQAAALTLVVALLAEPATLPLRRAVRVLWDSAAVR